MPKTSKQDDLRMLEMLAGKNQKDKGCGEAARRSPVYAHSLREGLSYACLKELRRARMARP